MNELEDNSPHERFTVIRTAIENYPKPFLKEPSRPPSRGGNMTALHAHRILIEGSWYSFLALGANKWVFASDTVEFDWHWNPTSKYRNIFKDSVKVWAKNDQMVVRGNRGTKPQLRTAQTRLPGRRSEWKD